MVNDELWVKAIGVIARILQLSMLSEYEQHHAEHEEQGELHEYDHAAGEQRRLAVLLIPRREQSLYKCLIRPMAGHGEKRAAKNAGPERVALCEAEREVKDRELAARRRRDPGNLQPATRNLVEQQEECHERAREVECKLDYVRPDHSAHAAFEGIKQGEQRDNRDRDSLACSESDADNLADGRYSNAFRERPRKQENYCGCRTHSAPKSLFEKLVSRVEFALEILRDQYNTQNHARDKIAQHNLQEFEVSAVSDAGSADNCERRGFGGDNRTCDRPPGRCPTAKKIISKAVLTATEIRAEKRDAHKIENEDSEIDWADLHRTRTCQGWRVARC